MRAIKRLAYTHIHPEWLAPSGQVYHIRRDELRRRFVLMSGEKAIFSHIKSDVLLLYLLKHELGWDGNTRQPFKAKELERLQQLERAFCLGYQGMFR